MRRMNAIVLCYAIMNYNEIRPEFFNAKQVKQFWSRVDKRGIDECWPWLGTKSKKAKCKRGFYGRWFSGGIQYMAHRVAYVFTFGPIPPTLTIDHGAARGCDGELCCNPAHLEPVSPSVNSSRYQATLPTIVTCSQPGHSPRPRGSGPCRQCRTAQVAATFAKYPEKYREMRRLQKQKERSRKRLKEQVIA